MQSGKIKSEVAQVEILVFYIVVLGIFNATFSRKPHEGWLVSSRDTSSWRFRKITENKENLSF